MKASCKAIVPARWYKPNPTPCKLPAWRDGFCRKHHPANRAKSGTVENQLTSARKALSVAEGRVQHWRTRIIELEAEKERWNAFLAGSEKPRQAKSVSEGAEPRNCPK